MLPGWEQSRGGGEGLTRKPWFLDSFLCQQRTQEPDFSGTLGEEDEMKNDVDGGYCGERETETERQKDRERQYDAIGNFPSL